MKKFSLVIALVIVILFAVITPNSTHTTGIAFAAKMGTTVETQNGLVIGTEEAKDGYETWSWKGMPFAQPPERWKAPHPHENWGTLAADTFGSHCPQYVMTSTGYVLSGSEDCLYLNVWRPRTQEHNLPVYFWIHGGGNSTGTASEPWYHGNKLAPRANMVVVTTNYRLGPLGWFVLPESLQDGNPLDDSGNYGTLDIIQALRWVRANIAAFGGNPNNITIAGESAGGFNVCTLLISPEAKGLFHKAISESGGFVFDTTSMDVGRDSTQEAINRIISNDRYADPSFYPRDLKAYLLSKTPKEIFDVYPIWIRGMLNRSGFVDRFTDGAVISALGKDALKNPETYNQVPTILGTNKEEAKFFMAQTGMYGTMTDEEYQDSAITDSMKWQQAGVNDLAAAMSANKGQPRVFAYQFNYGAYNEGGYNAWLSSPPSPYPYDIMIGSSHGLEIPFIFGEWTYGYIGQFIFRTDNAKGREALSDSMVKYWAFFARTGNPADPSGVIWKPWSNKEAGAKRIIFDADDTESIIKMSNQ